MMALDRRQVVGMAGSAALVVVVMVLGLGLEVVNAAPFPPPSVNSCYSWEGCCPPKSKVRPIAFTFPSSRTPMRTRQAAHLVNAAWIAKYRKAYAMMRNLSRSDPRSLMNQAKLHCAYCGAAFTYPNSQYGLEIHNGWFFFAWHRAFLYFHERILGSLINDPTFALPFWNWDNQGNSNTNGNGPANTMPTYFNSPSRWSNSLWDSNRNPCALPPHIIDLNSGGGCTNESPANLITENSRLMATQMKTATSQLLFFGSPFSFGQQGGDGGGNLEGAPHGTVHVLTGNPDARSNPYDDMGNLDVAARDPLFYVHHANLDRLWEVWKTAGGRGNRVDITNPDYLNTQFIFYDEKARLVSIKVSQVLNLPNLRYNYQNVPNPWLNPSSQVTTMSIDPLSGSLPPVTKCAPPSQDNSALIKSTPVLNKNKPTVFTSKLTFKLRLFDPTNKREQNLLFAMLSIDWTKTATINAYLFYPGADGSTVDCMEFLGTFAHIPEANHRMKPGYTMSWRVGLSQKIDQLGLVGVDWVVLTLVQTSSVLQTIQFGRVVVETSN